jgi:putative nucleotidyltransferase with HDIG domain
MLHQHANSKTERLLKTLEGVIPFSITDAFRYESMREERGEFQGATDEIIHAVSLLVECKDPYTAVHQRRVAELAQAIAGEMGLSEWWAIGIYTAGLLHDIGKVAIPSRVLNKPGRLSEHEFGLIKDHPRIGYEILERTNFPWPVTLAILQHHEKLNGSGYPDGLSGEDIIMEARILGVADVVEAMTSRRPYHPARGLDVALDEISEQRGVLYDAEVADTCLRLLRRSDGQFDILMAAAADRGQARTRPGEV